MLFVLWWEELLMERRIMVGSFDLVCFSHLRWDFVYQRPQHLLSRCALERRVFYIEEPLFEGNFSYLHVSKRQNGLVVVVPHLPREVSDVQAQVLQTQMIDNFFASNGIENYVCWYYTAMALPFTKHLEPLAVVYDCMDELSAFQGASSELRQRESELLSFADLVFTGGYSLYEAKRYRHQHVHPFPSSVDTAHFRKARDTREEPADQASIPQPRLGFYGVIDERMDLDLITAIAEARPDWQIVLVGPVVKIDQQVLPQRQNIHYLGGKHYNDLPDYLAGWDVALLPFALNEATRFISPTKTPEYLAAGKPVVSTAIRDVIHPYGEQNFVAIAETADDFIATIEQALQDNDPLRLHKVDAFLAHMSWDITWKKMSQLIETVVESRQDWLPFSLVLQTQTDISSVGGLE
jgi:UDP-galactopyranose mutase